MSKEYTIKDLLIQNKIENVWVCQAKVVNENNELGICWVKIKKSTNSNRNTSARTLHIEKKHTDITLAGKQRALVQTNASSILDLIKKTKAIPYEADDHKNRLINEKVLNFIIANNLPLLIVDNKEFRELLEVLDPRFVPK